MDFDGFAVKKKHNRHVTDCDNSCMLFFESIAVSEMIMELLANISKKYLACTKKWSTRVFHLKVGCELCSRQETLYELMKYYEVSSPCDANYFVRNLITFLCCNFTRFIFRDEASPENTVSYKSLHY